VEPLPSPKSIPDRTLPNAASAAARFSASNSSDGFEAFTIASIYSKNVRRSAENPVRESAQAAVRIRPLRRREIPEATLEQAEFLIGKTLVREIRGIRMSGRI